MGLSGLVLNWFTSFLRNRSQSFKVNQPRSMAVPVTLGVLQGFFLSPTLFNLFMELLTEILHLSNIHFHMYADDTQLYLKINSPDDIKSLNLTLRKTQSWLTENHLKLNALKTEFLLIAPPNQTAIIQEWLKQFTALNCQPLIIDSAKSL